MHIMTDSPIRFPGLFGDWAFTASGVAFHIGGKAIYWYGIIIASGLLLAVELGESAKLYRIMELFREAGILSDWFLFCDTAFRISPPLTISEDEVRESAALIRSCLDRL